MRAVAKLYSPGTHKNIVTVLRYGKLPNMPYYFLDMELCELNLEIYIKQQWRASMEKRLPAATTNISQMLSNLRMLQIRDIMKDISRGVAFIHVKKEIHRDLEP